MPTAFATFDIRMTPVAPELGGAAGRFEFTKSWEGDLAGSGEGVMLSGGDPESGAAGYVAFETVTGALNGREGAFAFQQFGTMRDGAEELRYEIVPGSGTGDLVGITGTVEMEMTEEGDHRVGIVYTLAAPA